MVIFQSQEGLLKYDQYVMQKREFLNKIIILICPFKNFYFGEVTVTTNIN